MSISDDGSATPAETPPAAGLPTASPPSTSPPAKRGFWSFLGNAAVLGVVLGALGTGFVSLLQYVSAYHDSVAKLAKDDLDNGTAALTEAVTALANPLSLQERLIWFYSAAKKNNTDADDAAYETRNARAISKNYEDSVIALSAGIKLLARKMELYLDLPGDLNHAADNNSSADVEPIGTSSLRGSDFVCDDRHMPFAKDESGKVTAQLRLTSKKDSDLTSSKPLAINWKSAKDNLLTLEYCFEVTHEGMGEIRRWASQSSNDALQSPKSAKSNEFDLGHVKALAKLQEQRFNDFMSVATFKIEQFRIRYQPNGFLCTVLGMDAIFPRLCTPHLTATG